MPETIKYTGYRVNEHNNYFGTYIFLPLNDKL